MTSKKKRKKTSQSAVAEATRRAFLEVFGKRKGVARSAKITRKVRRKGKKPSVAKIVGKHGKTAAQKARYRDYLGAKRDLIKRYFR